MSLEASPPFLYFWRLVHSSLLWSFQNLSSLIFYFTYLGLLSFFLDEPSGNFVYFMYLFKEPTLGFIDFFSFSPLFHLFLFNLRFSFFLLNLGFACCLKCSFESPKTAFVWVIIWSFSQIYITIELSLIWKWKWLSCVRLFLTLWTI